MQLTGLPATGVHHPEMRLAHIKMPTHQREHPPKHDGFKLSTIRVNEMTTRGLVL